MYHRVREDEEDFGIVILYFSLPCNCIISFTQRLFIIGYFRFSSFISHHFPNFSIGVGPIFSLNYGSVKFTYIQ